MLNLPDKQIETSSTLFCFMASTIFFIPVDITVVGPATESVLTVNLYRGLKEMDFTTAKGKDVTLT